MKKSIVLTIVALVIILIYIFPVFWMVLSSFKTTQEVVTQKFFPSKLMIENYTYLLKQSGIVRWLFNSFFISIISTIGVVIVSVLAAYSLGRLKFPGNGILFI